MKSLKSVTFKRGPNGEIKIPYIHSNAFANSGTKDSPIVFNMPWSRAQHYNKFEGLNSEGNLKDPTFGAKYYKFNFTEEAN
jgi:hypothetical protein